MGRWQESNKEFYLSATEPSEPWRGFYWQCTCRGGHLVVCGIKRICQKPVVRGALVYRHNKAFVVPCFLLEPRKQQVRAINVTNPEKSIDPSQVWLPICLAFSSAWWRKLPALSYHCMALQHLTHVLHFCIGKKSTTCTHTGLTLRFVSQTVYTKMKKTDILKNRFLYLWCNRSECEITNRTHKQCMSNSTKVETKNVASRKLLSISSYYMSSWNILKLDKD